VVAGLPGLAAGVILDVDGEPVWLCGPPVTDPDALEAVAEVVRAARRQFATLPPRCRAQPPAEAGRHLPCLLEPHDSSTAHRDARDREWT